MGLDHRGNRVGALGGRRTTGRELTGVRFVVTRQVERNDPIPCLHQRFDEHCQMRSLAAPTVHQIYRRPLAPFLTSDPVPIPIRFYRPARGHTRRHAQARLENRWGAPQLDRPPRSQRGRQPLEQPKKSAYSDSDRGNDSGADDVERADSPDCAGAPSVMNRDRSMGREPPALWDSRALGAQSASLASPGWGTLFSST